MKINNRVKLSIYKDEKIIIENYQDLNDITESTIVVDLYTINGNFLKIRKMDNYMIEISGKISQIIINKWEIIKL